MPFFFLELNCVTSLFLSFFFFSRLFFFFFFSWSCAVFFFSFRCWTFLLFHSEWCRICSSSFWSIFVVSYFVLLLFSVLDFSPFTFWGVPNLFFLFLVSFPCFLFSGGLVFSPSLSFDRLNKALRNRFPIVLSRFSDRLRGTMVTQSYYTHDTDMPSSGAK